MYRWRSRGYIEWVQDNTAYLSVIFSWNLAKAYKRAIWHRKRGYRVVAGGPAVILNPGYLSDVADVGIFFPDVIARHNPNATFTSRGCIRNCSFCAVPKIEGQLLELPDWPVRPVVCDNNFLACSRAHFDAVIDKLKPLEGVDFNQGLDARLLTPYHAERLRELDMYCARLAWDHTSMEDSFLSAYQILRDAGFWKRKIRVYVLIGFNDDPDDALYRLETVRNLGSRPNPMRYQPLDLEERNGYVHPNWTDYELKRFMRYWSRLRWFEHIPFKDFEGRGEMK